MINQRLLALEHINIILKRNSDVFCLAGRENQLILTYRKGQVLEITPKQWMLLGVVGTLIDLFGITLEELVKPTVEQLKEQE